MKDGKSTESLALGSGNTASSFREQMEQIMAKDILQPVDTTNSSSPSIKRAAESPSDWRGQGSVTPKDALARDPRKNPVAPQNNK